MALLVLLNNFLHDFSAAGWLFGTVLLWIILKRLPGAREGTDALRGVLRPVVRLMGFSMAGIIIFGVIRAFAYRQYEWNADAGQSQVTLLLVKHIFLAGLATIGFLLVARARKALREE